MVPWEKPTGHPGLQAWSKKANKIAKMAFVLALWFQVSRVFIGERRNLKWYKRMNCAKRKKGKSIGNSRKTKDMSRRNTAKASKRMCPCWIIARSMRKGDFRLDSRLFSRLLYLQVLVFFWIYGLIQLNYFVTSPKSAWTKTLFKTLGAMENCIRCNLEWMMQRP